MCDVSWDLNSDPNNFTILLNDFSPSGVTIPTETECKDFKIIDKLNINDWMNDLLKESLTKNN